MIETSAFLRDLDTGTIYPLKPGKLIVGRLANVDVALTEDFAVSARHACLEHSAGGWALTPLSATAPTFLDGKEATGTTRLAPGSVITIGNSKLELGEGHVEQGKTQATQIVYGRDPLQADAVLDHPTISRRHALFQSGSGAGTIADLGSSNGTFVDGVAISSKPVPLRDGQIVQIGPYKFQVAQGQLKEVQARQDAALLSAVGLTYVVRDRTSGEPLTLLENVTTQIQRGTFTCIIGESGSGKSTLIKQLSGRVEAQSGLITVRGLDLNSHFESLKREIAYVPQDDLLHDGLTLEQALTYCARLRLPSDQTSTDVERAVESAMTAVDLQARAGIAIRDLSGGQKKRASLACELLTKPSLLLLDEVTSGLDEATDREVMALLQSLAKDGVTVVCVTHTLANIEQYCDRLIIMARGGLPVFDGPPMEALSHFGIGRLGDVFDKLAEARFREEARSRLIAEAATASPATANPSASRIKSSGAGLGEKIRQMSVLLSRNVRLKLADRKGLWLAAIQAVVIGGLLGYAFSDFGSGGQIVQSQISLLMLLGMASLWIGCNSASQDIVGERTIFDRERDINLSPTAFVLAKGLVTSGYTILQLAVVVVLLAIGAQEIPGGAVLQFPLIAFGGMAGVAIGLTISAWSGTRDQANILVPLALIPQLILAGTLVPALPQLGKTLSEFAVSAYWITEGLKANFIDVAGQVMMADMITGQPKELAGVEVNHAWQALLLHMALFVALAVSGARRKQQA